MQSYQFTVVFERDEDGRIVAVVPALPGCYTEAETMEEARELVQDAIRLHVEDRLARGEPISQEITREQMKVAV